MENQFKIVQDRLTELENALDANAMDESAYLQNLISIFSDLCGCEISTIREVTDYILGMDN